MSTLVSGLALILSVAALVLGWTAFNRTGVDVEAVIEERTQSAVGEVRQELLQFQADVSARFNAAAEPAEEAATSSESEEASAE